MQSKDMNSKTKLLVTCSILFYLGLNHIETTAQTTLIDDVNEEVKVYTYRLKGKTATGHLTWKVKEPFLAISRDLIDRYPLRSEIELYDCPWAGVYKVLDLMGKSNQQAVDIFYRGPKRNTIICKCRKR
ncbi:MAG: hypothetical protein WBO36_11065 [Saprospiraceae bacterium]